MSVAIKFWQVNPRNSKAGTHRRTFCEAWSNMEGDRSLEDVWQFSKSIFPFVLCPDRLCGIVCMYRQTPAGHTVYVACVRQQFFRPGNQGCSLPSGDGKYTYTSSWKVKTPRRGNLCKNCLAYMVCLIEPWHLLPPWFGSRHFDNICTVEASL